jgi:hypothetical protein
MLKVPCNPIGASPIPIAVTKPGDECSEVETGGTSLWNLRHMCDFIRARVIESTGPSTRVGVLSPKGFLPTQEPLEMIVVEIRAACSWQFLTHDFTSVLELKFLDCSKSSQVVSTTHCLRSASLLVKVLPVPVPSNRKNLMFESLANQNLSKAICINAGNTDLTRNISIRR